MFDFRNGPFTGMSGPAPVDEFPTILTYEDVRRTFWQLPECEYLLGTDGSGDPVTISVGDGDSPHVFVSAASGAGKSVIARSIATQALIKGSVAAFLDVKRISHRWAKNLPQVHYASEVEEIANALVSVAAEVHKRMKVIDEFPGPVEDAPIGPRIILVVEELNQTIGALEDFEKTLPLRGVYRPRRAFADIVNLGRAAKVNIVTFAQYPDLRVISKALLESFGTRVIIRHTNESWKALAWQLGYCPPAPQQVGRGHVVLGDKAIQTQFLYMPEELAAQLVRDAWAARERVGLTTPPEPSRRERRRLEREAHRTIDALER